MPAFQTDITAAAARVRAVATIPIDNVRVRAVGLNCVTENQSPDDLWAEIGIMNGTNNTENVATVLAAGYLGTFNSIGWQGDIKGDASQWIYAAIWAKNIT